MHWCGIMLKICIIYLGKHVANDARELLYTIVSLKSIVLVSIYQAALSIFQINHNIFYCSSSHKNRIIIENALFFSSKTCIFLELSTTFDTFSIT